MYSIEYHIGALFVTLFAVFDLYSRKDMRKINNKSFMILVLSHLTAILFVIWTTISNNKIGAYSLIFRDFVNHGFLLAHNSSAYVFAIYTVFLLGFNQKKKGSYFFWLSLPIASTVFLLLLNPWKRWVFYYSPEGIYSHGSLIYLLYFNALFYLIYASILTAKLRKTLGRNKTIALAVFLAFSTIPVAIQMLFPYLNIEIFLQSLAILGVLWTIENEAEIFNKITKTYNRFAFFSDVGTALGNNLIFEIITIKLPNTNYFNATFGYSYMNEVTAKIATWLNRLTPELGVYDCEKGHFAVVNFANSPVSSKKLVKRISERFLREWEHNNTYVTFPVQIAVLRVPSEVSNIEEIMFLVDRLYRSRELTTQVVSTEILHAYQRETEVTRAIEHALEKDKFTLHYQPIWDNRVQRFTSVEALARLFDHKLGYIAPEEFIAIAEKTGSIMEIGEVVLVQVCKLLQENDLEKMGISYITINLSIVQCMNQRLVERFGKILRYYQVDAAKINLEITESATTNNFAFLLNTMEGLRGLGFSLALDDYGTGYSNVSQILNMPFQVIKLDKSILWSADENKNARIMLKNTIIMMKEMGFEVLAEGVETETQTRFLTELGCDYLQGFFLAKPMDQQDLFSFCQTNLGGLSPLF